MASKIEKTGADNLLEAWVLEDPAISNYALQKRLQNRSISITSPTIKKWRDKFDQSVDKDLLKNAKKIVDSEILVKYNDLLADKALTTIDKYLGFLDLLETKIKELEQIQNQRVKRYLQQLQEAHRIAGESDNEVLIDQNDAIEAKDLDTEKIIIQYWKLLDSFNTKIFRLTGGAEYISQMKNIIEKASLLAIETFFPHIIKDKKDETRKLFKSKIDKFIREDILDKLPNSYKENKVNANS